MASKPGQFIPTRKEALNGLLYAVLTFLILLALAYNKGKENTPSGPSVMGSIAINSDASSHEVMSPLPANWEVHTEILDGFRVPFINAKKERVFDLYKRPVQGLTPAQMARPKIALLVMGLAYDAENTQKIMDMLPAEAGIAIMPRAPYAEKLYPAVSNDRRELWLHMPSISKNALVNEGLDALKINTPTRGNMDLLHKNMAALHYYTGMVLSPDSALPASSEDFTPIMDELALRGIGLIVPEVTPDLSLMQNATASRLPFVASGFAISVSPMADDIRARLDATLARAREAGGALAVITEANEISINTVKEWLDLNKDQFTLVPPSALAQ